MNNLKKFQSTNEESMRYYSTVMGFVESFLISLSKLASEEDIYFDYPYEIHLASDWMAHGVILNWIPHISDGNNAYSTQLAFIWSGLYEKIICIRAVVHNNRERKNEYKRAFIVESNDDIGLTPEQAFEAFLKNRELDENLRTSMNAINDMLEKGERK